MWLHKVFYMKKVGLNICSISECLIPIRAHQSRKDICLCIFGQLGFSVYNGCYLPKHMNYWELSQNMWYQYDCFHYPVIAHFVCTTLLWSHGLSHCAVNHLQSCRLSHYQAPWTRASHCLVITVVWMFKMPVSDHLEILWYHCSNSFWGLGSLINDHLLLLSLLANKA